MCASFWACEISMLAKKFQLSLSDPSVCFKRENPIRLWKVALLHWLQPGTSENTHGRTMRRISVHKKNKCTMRFRARRQTWGMQSCMSMHHTHTYTHTQALLCRLVVVMTWIKLLIHSKHGQIVSECVFLWPPARTQGQVGVGVGGGCCVVWEGSYPSSLSLLAKPSLPLFEISCLDSATSLFFFPFAHP